MAVSFSTPGSPDIDVLTTGSVTDALAGSVVVNVYILSGTVAYKRQIWSL